MSLLNLFATVLLAMTSLYPMTSMATQHVGQVKLYVDKAAMTNWYKATGKTSAYDFKREMNSSFFEINQVLKTMKPNGVDIQLQLSDVTILGKNILNANSNGMILDTVALETFHSFVSPGYSNDPYDLALLYTGYNLATSSSDGVAGYAYVASVCSANALGVVELKGVYMDVLLTAHEIGHILGSHHDGTDNARSCGSQSGNVMNAIVSPSSIKHFSYSTCSASQIKNHFSQLAKDNKNCMATWSASGTLTGPRYGALMTPDEVCKRGFGSDRYVARKAYGEYGDNVCTQLACMTKTQGTYFQWTFAATPPGMNCGKNKQCIQGKCVKTSTGSASVSDTCPFGDQPKIEGSYQMTCADMTSSMCSGWKKTCCQTCSDPGTADDVCRGLLGKESAMARRAYKTYGDPLCSKLACLSGVKDNVFSWKYYTAPNGMKCGANKRCSNGKCAVSKTGDPLTSDTCPFGDQPWLGGRWQMTCPDYIGKHGCGENWFKEVCCGSCTDPGTADDICKKLENNKNAALARYHYSSYGDNLCSQLACMTRIDGNSFYWNYHKAPEGMKCGKNKRCASGKCVTTKAGDPNMSDTCPYGDQPWLGGNYQTDCPTYVRKYGCRAAGWNHICCSSC